jgi:Xaa-Pro aminopeptidase
MRAFFTLMLVMCLSLIGFAQESDLPSDFLTKTFYKDRRDKLRDKLPANSVAVFFANAVRNRANDLDYLFHQDPDFYYLTGYKEPNSLLLVFKDQQTAANGTTYNEIVFVQPRDERAEQLTGRRLGDKGVKNQLGLDQSFNNSEFKRYKVDFSKFASVLFFDFKNDVRNDPNDSSDLYDLIVQFKSKTNYPEKNATTLTVELEKNNLDAKGLSKIMNNLRGIKTEEELVMIRKAVKISCASQVEVMKAIKPGMSEREIDGIHQYVFKKYQAEDMGYPSIVGAGHNGCVLHYMENYKPSISNKELILMDLGAEYHGYSADITRTIPVNGKFSPEQKIIYELVLKAQEEAMKVCKAGTPFPALYAATAKIIGQGLKELGIIQNEADARKYYPHGCCHHIGLDVHDRGNYEQQEENMVITIEPGIYIPDNSPCDKKWWGIAVRIEDDYLITKDGYEHLSASAPRTVKDIEAMMKLPSPLDNFVLPDLDKKN